MGHDAFTVATRVEQPDGKANTAEANDLDLVAGLSSDLICGVCGFGIAVYVTPPQCPMWREHAWRPAAQRLARADV